MLVPAQYGGMIEITHPAIPSERDVEVMNRMFEIVTMHPLVEDDVADSGLLSEVDDA